MSPLRSLLATLLLSSLALLAACSGTPHKLPPVTTGEPSSAPTQPGTSTPVPAPPPAVREPATPEPVPQAQTSLLAKADSARARGDYDQALAILERAQRIDPDNAEVYLAMARTQAAAGHADKARTVAERGLLYCGGAAQCNALRAFLN